jgi:hypothetical protein
MKALTEQEIQTLEIIRNISHESIDRITNVFLALQSYAFLQYVDGEPITIPYFGNFILRYKGDKIDTTGREAQVESFFVPSEMMKENIGECEDYKEDPSLGIGSISIFKQLQNVNERQLRKELNNELSNEEDDNF